jgi:hypothetical protein
MLVNSGSIGVLCLRNEVVGSAAVARQLRFLSQASGPVRVDFGPFRSIRKRLEDRGIRYAEGPVRPGATDVIVIAGSFGRALAVAHPDAAQRP